MWGLGFRVSGLESRVKTLGFRLVAWFKDTDVSSLGRSFFFVCRV